MSVKVSKKEIRMNAQQYEYKWRLRRRSKCKRVNHKLPLNCHLFQCKQYATNSFLTRVLQRRGNGIALTSSYKDKVR